MNAIVPVLRAMATNVVAGVAPQFYLRATRQTGRGDPRDESPLDVADYFQRCFDDYLERLGIRRESAESVLAGRTLVEYGPGDLPGVAALFVAFGAERVFCVDRFAMVQLSEKNLRVLAALRCGLPESCASRLDRLVSKSARGGHDLDPARIRYVVRPHGFSGLDGVADFVLSRAVLEHVDNLEGTFADMRRALRPGGRALHQVDLRSHGLHRRNPLDFLEWPQWLWRLMFSHKGVPNRWRIDRYRQILGDLGVEEVGIEVTAMADCADVDAVRPRLAAPFRPLTSEDLAAVGLWLSFRKPVA